MRRFIRPRLNSIVMSAAACCVLTTSVLAQPVRQDVGQVVEFADQYNERYLRQEPPVGETLPNVKLFDAEGNPFELASTRGKYTVLVFGCLT